MKFLIAVVLLAAVSGIYSEPPKSGIGAKAGASLPPADVAAINAILSEMVGPELSGAVTKLIESLANLALSGTQLRSLLHDKSPENVEKILSPPDASDPNANVRDANGILISITPAGERRISKI